MLLPYRRLQENEADRIGLVLRAKAGYDPQAALGFWDRINAQGDARPPEFLSTHPALESRMQSLGSYLPEALKEYRPAK